MTPLLSPALRLDQEPADRRISQGPSDDDRQEIAGHLGRPAGPPLQARAHPCGGAAWPHCARAPAGPCPRDEPRRMHLGIPQASRRPQLLRHRFHRSRPPRPQEPALDAATRHARDRILQAGGDALTSSRTYARLNNCFNRRDWVSGARPYEDRRKAHSSNHSHERPLRTLSAQFGPKCLASRLTHGYPAAVHPASPRAKPRNEGYSAQRLVPVPACHDLPCRVCLCAWNDAAEHSGSHPNDPLYLVYRLALSYNRYNPGGGKRSIDFRFPHRVPPTQRGLP